MSDKFTPTQESLPTYEDLFAPVRLPDQIAMCEPIKVDDQWGGEVFPDLDLRSKEWESPDVQKIMSSVGFLFRDSITSRAAYPTEALAPTPRRLAAIVVANSLPIQLVPDANDTYEIPVSTYVEIGRNHMQPVGIAHIVNYIHDVGLDHMLAVAACGEKLFDEFDALEAQLDYERGVVSVGESMDRFTMHISNAILGLPYLYNNGELNPAMVGVIEKYLRLSHVAITGAEQSRKLRRLICDQLGALHDIDAPGMLLEPQEVTA